MKKTNLLIFIMILGLAPSIMGSVQDFIISDSDITERIATTTSFTNLSTFTINASEILEDNSVSGIINNISVNTLNYSLKLKHSTNMKTGDISILLGNNTPSDYNPICPIGKQWVNHWAAFMTYITRTSSLLPTNNQTYWLNQPASTEQQTACNNAQITTTFDEIFDFYTQGRIEDSGTVYQDDFYYTLNVTIDYEKINVMPNITNINCTSCNIPEGDNESPYSTSDTTPTFKFETDINANCRIGDENQNYTSMGESRNCTSGQNTGNHTCTLIVDDELIFSNDIAYISCENNFDNSQTSNASISLQMNITDLVANQSNAMEAGIEDSIIWPGATVYSDQQVYLRDLEDNQILATVDKVAVYGNQRWLLNYDNETTLGLFNITPSVYVLDMVNLSLSEIKNQITAYINETKN